MVEDGIEEENLFESNLGAITKITPNAGLFSFAESDMFASTFWISNPNNKFLNNVAAGSEDTGFWYEFLEFVRGKSTKFDPYYEINPSTYKFGFNIGTVCHSNTGDGFKLYPNGYFPNEEAVFKDFRSYVNKGDGVLLHNSAKLAIDGGYFGDNRQGIEVDKQSDAVRISNAHIVGFSDLYKNLVDASGKQSHCPAYRPMVGIQLHSYLRYRDSTGYIIDNVRFEKLGYTVSGCHWSAAINIDPQVRDNPPHYDAYATFSNLSFDTEAPGEERFNGCLIWDSGVRDMAINDVTGDLNPINPGTPGYIVSDDPKMTLHSTTPCHAMPGSCTAYCESLCYRTLNIAVPGTDAYADMILEVEGANGNKQNFLSTFEYMLKGNVNSTYDNFMYQRRRFFSPILPYGNYTLRFKLNNQVVFPTMIEKVWDDIPQCTPYLDNDNIQLVIPEPTEMDCFELVKNNGLQDENLNFWFHTGSDLKLTSPGFASMRAIQTVWRKGTWQGLGQFLDTRCIVAGKQYEVTARYRLYDELNGGFKSCNANSAAFMGEDVCPCLSLRFRKFHGDQIGDEIESFYAYPIAEAVAPIDVESWNLLYGVLTVSTTMASADSVFIFMERGPSGTNFWLDDLSVKPISQGCEDESFNRGFETGDTRWWTVMGDAATQIVSPGYNSSQFAMKTTSRKQYWSSMAQKLGPECLEEGQFFHVKAKIKLEQNGLPYDCDPLKYWGVQSTLHLVCPSLALRVDVGNVTDIFENGKVIGPWKSGDWNEIFGLFFATPDLMTADSIIAYFTKFVTNTMIVIDDFSVGREENYGCDLNMIHNGNLEYGDYRSWDSFFDGQLEVSPVGFNGSAYALKYSQTSWWHEGVGQYLQRNCLDDSTEYEVSAQVRLFEEDGITPYLCNNTEVEEETEPARCPEIAVAHQYKGSFPTYNKVASLAGDWNVNDWNSFSGNFTLSSEQLNAFKLFLVVHHTKPGLVFLVDDLSMKKKV